MRKIGGTYNGSKNYYQDAVFWAKRLKINVLQMRQINQFCLCRSFNVGVLESVVCQRRGSVAYSARKKVAKLQDACQEHVP